MVDTAHPDKIFSGVAKPRHGVTAVHLAQASKHQRQQGIAAIRTGTGALPPTARPRIRDVFPFAAWHVVGARSPEALGQMMTIAIVVAPAIGAVIGSSRQQGIGILSRGGVGQKEAQIQHLVIGAGLDHHHDASPAGDEPVRHRTLHQERVTGCTGLILSIEGLRRIPAGKPPHFPVAVIAPGFGENAAPDGVASGQPWPLQHQFGGRAGIPAQNLPALAGRQHLLGDEGFEPVQEVEIVGGDTTGKSHGCSVVIAAIRAQRLRCARGR